MKIRYEPTFGSLTVLDDESDETRIKREAWIRKLIEYDRFNRTLTSGLPPIPSFEEMKFDRDRGL